MAAVLLVLRSLSSPGPSRPPVRCDLVLNPVGFLGNVVIKVLKAAVLQDETGLNVCIGPVM